MDYAPPPPKKKKNVVYIIMLEYKTFSKYSTVQRKENLQHINPCYTPLVCSSFDDRAHALRILILTANRTVKTSQVLCPSSLVSFLPCRVGNRHVLQDRANSLFPM